VRGGCGCQVESISSEEILAAPANGDV